MRGSRCPHLDVWDANNWGVEGSWELGVLTPKLTGSCGFSYILDDSWSCEVLLSHEHLNICRIQNDSPFWILRQALRSMEFEVWSSNLPTINTHGGMGGMNILKKMGREPTMLFFFERPSDKSIFRLKAIILNNIHFIFHPNLGSQVWRMMTGLLRRRKRPFWFYPWPWAPPYTASHASWRCHVHGLEVSNLWIKLSSGPWTFM